MPTRAREVQAEWLLTSTAYRDSSNRLLASHRPQAGDMGQKLRQIPGPARPDRIAEREQLLRRRHRSHLRPGYDRPLG